MDSRFCVLAMLAAALAAGAATPNYQGCLPGSPGAKLAWCDFSKSHADRIASLLQVLTVDEKIALLSPDKSLGSDCNDHTRGAPRVGLTPTMWLVETNTAANSACLGKGKCATTFNGPLGMGASFNRTSWRAKGSVIGTELRAFNNIGWHRDAGGTTSEKIGVTGFGPNINNPRDPRFGRLSELPGEDPYHSGHYAAAMLSGMQEEDSNGHPKMVSFLKCVDAVAPPRGVFGRPCASRTLLLAGCVVLGRHFTAYSKETNRGHDS